MSDSDNAWRWTKTSNVFYYCLDNISDRTPKYYRSMFGTAEELKEAMQEDTRCKSQKQRRSGKKQK